MKTIVQIGLALLQRIVAIMEFLFTLGTRPAIQCQVRVLDTTPTSIGTRDDHEGSRRHDGFVIIIIIIVFGVAAVAVLTKIGLPMIHRRGIVVIIFVDTVNAAVTACRCGCGCGCGCGRSRSRVVLRQQAFVVVVVDGVES